ncbi:MAG: hypothetical protein JO110_26110, partial [Acetobacteraceae bacterium]|nr:hypothetical protein [Acetobacteraceae bacterium]
MYIRKVRETAWPVLLAVVTATLFGTARIASAQQIEPNDILPLPNGTNISLGYFVYGHQGAFINTDGNNVPDSSANAYIGVARFIRYQYLFG